MKPISDVNMELGSHYLIPSYQTKQFVSQNITEYHYEFLSSPDTRTDLQRSNLLPLEDRPFIRLHIVHSVLGITGFWRPDSGFQKNLCGDWSQGFQTNIGHSAPVLCFFDCEDRNCLTLSLDELNRDVCFTTGVHEETAEIYTDIIIYLAETALPYRICCRVDQRPIPFYQAVKDVSAWWDSILPEAPLGAPGPSTMPMYSTWYSYHQDITAERLLAECALAADLGMKSVIIDDGWQTADNHRGYGYCGDWKPEPSKFPDFRDFTDRLHQLGMNCILWYSVPFVGEYSALWSRFHSCLLHYDPALHAGILDPRYPQVRSHLITVYKEAVSQWNLDGLKLDFIDSFRSYPDTPPVSEEMDFAEIPDAVYHLMLDIRYALTKIRPNLMLEFRQNYTGPQMRRFGNLFRVGDCPLSGVTNRIGITDLKLLCGSGAVHSDMILWHPEEAPEDVAIQLIHCMFATMQISVQLHTLSPAQRQVLKRYLDFSVEYREILLDGDFCVSSPLCMYPILQSAARGVRIAAVYDAGCCIDFSDRQAEDTFWILNATHSARQYLLLPDADYRFTLYDCCGVPVLCENYAAKNHQVTVLPAAPGGSILLRREKSGL